MRLQVSLSKTSSMSKIRRHKIILYSVNYGYYHKMVMLYSDGLPCNFFILVYSRDSGCHYRYKQIASFFFCLILWDKFDLRRREWSHLSENMHMASSRKCKCSSKSKWCWRYEFDDEDDLLLKKLRTIKIHITLFSLLCFTVAKICIRTI